MAIGIAYYVGMTSNVSPSTPAIAYNASQAQGMPYGDTNPQASTIQTAATQSGEADPALTQSAAHSAGAQPTFTQSINDPGVPEAPSAPGAPGTETSSSIDVLERTEEEKAPGDNDRYAHYVRQDKIMRSMVDGGPVVALCGKVWTPVRNPDGYPICPTCKAIYEDMKKGGFGGGTWPFGPQPPK